MSIEVIILVVIVIIVMKLIPAPETQQQYLLTPALPTRPRIMSLQFRPTHLIVSVLAVICLIPAYAAEPDCEAYRRGIKQYESWQYADAFESFLEADKLVPNNGYNYYYAGQIMCLDRQYKKAYNLALQALVYFEPEDLIVCSDTYQFLAFLTNSYSDEIEELSGDDTAGFYDAAVEIAPSYWKAYLERGNYYNIYRNEYSRSDADYKKAIELNPKEVEAYSRLIWSYKERGKLEEAEMYCRMCMTADLDYPHHYDILAKLLLKKGKRKEARDILWQAFMKANGKYYQGMETVIDFPEEDQRWFEEQIRCQAASHPDQPHWQEYLE